jgi:hypothetical protein
VLIKIDAHHGSGKIGRIGQRRCHIAVGTRVHSRGSNGRVELHVERNPHQADADHTNHRPATAD